MKRILGSLSEKLGYQILTVICRSSVYFIPPHIASPILRPPQLYSFLFVFFEERICVLLYRLIPFFVSLSGYLGAPGGIRTHNRLIRSSLLGFLLCVPGGILSIKRLKIDENATFWCTVCTWFTVVAVRLQ